jgi:preprotein translocase subunit SecE
MPQHVTIMRKWNHPQIHITINEEEINLKMDLHEFMSAVREEIGRVTWTFTKETFDEQFNNAVSKVITAVKRETHKVVS